jgi:hypothetical protein
MWAAEELPGARQDLGHATHQVGSRWTIDLADTQRTNRRRRPPWRCDLLANTICNTVGGRIDGS